MYILGLHLSHNATACLLKDGVIIGCISEERLVRTKNYEGFPSRAIDELYRINLITEESIDYIVVCGEFTTPAWNPLVEQNKWYGQISFSFYSLLSRFSLLEKFTRHLFNIVSKKINKIRIYELLKKKFPQSLHKVCYAPHHACHIFTALYGFTSDRDLKDLLLVSHDGEGDFLCGEVGSYSKGNYTQLAAIPAGNSLAAPYLCTTVILGMKPNEHEYKVMGLAPYASDTEISKVYPIFDQLIRVAGLQFVSRISIRAGYLYLKRSLVNCRFDAIAGAVQRFVELRACEWIKNCISVSKIDRIILTGGFFMNIKVNKLIAELPEVKELIVCPSAGDESSPIGACYWGYKKYCSKESSSFAPCPLQHLYLGSTYTDHEIELELSSHSNLYIQCFENSAEEVVRLLIDGKIVARFAGRAEWGARALGNRSILSHPSLIQNVRVINDQIKARDFWMPFSPTILDYRAGDYIINPKRVNSAFMQMSFDTTQLGRKDFAAAIHPYDYSVRPQVLQKEQNEQYYNLITLFEEHTGIGGLLNTSFNLHGDPIVYSPKDALETFMKSGLEYLAIGSYLVTKR